MPFSLHTKLTSVNTYTRDGAFRYINQGLRIIKSTLTNDSLKKPFNLTVFNGFILIFLKGIWKLDTLFSVMDSWL